MSKAQAATSSEGLAPPGTLPGRPVDADRLTRKPLALWDRIKFLVMLALIWLILTWSVMANDPLVGFSDAVRIEVRTGWWVFVLAGIAALLIALVTVSFRAINAALSNPVKTMRYE